LPITVFSKTEMHDLSPELKNVNKIVNALCSTHTLIGMYTCPKLLLARKTTMKAAKCARGKIFVLF
jgi:hypothetical protein